MCAFKHSSDINNLLNFVEVERMDAFNASFERLAIDSGKNIILIE